MHSLKAELALARWRGEGIKVSGKFVAEVEQICVVTLDPFRAEVSDTIERYFLPKAGPADEEAGIDSLQDGAVELGEIVVEGLSLALDPYPRKPGAEFEGLGDDQAAADAPSTSSPFSALACRASPTAPDSLFNSGNVKSSIARSRQSVPAFGFPRRE